MARRTDPQRGSLEISDRDELPTLTRKCRLGGTDGSLLHTSFCFTALCAVKQKLWVASRLGGPGLGHFPARWRPQTMGFGGKSFVWRGNSSQPRAPHGSDGQRRPNVPTPARSV